MGCGLTYLEGWINCDASPSVRVSQWPKPIVSLLRSSGFIGADIQRFWHFLESHPVHYVNALKPWPFSSDSVDVIYSSHVIDCFSSTQKKHFFKESYRVLKPGGVIRLVGIDLAHEVRLYSEGHDAEKLVSIVSYPNPNDDPFYKRIRKALWPPKYYLAHLDSNSYIKLLGDVGFVDIVNLPPGVTTIKNIEPVNLNQRRGESLYVEAYKPSNQDPPSP